MEIRHTFGKEEKLKSRKLISRVFSDGSVHKSFPIKAHYIVHEEEDYSGVRVTFVVPKRSFKKAVDRNRIKRQMRESYRLQKSELVALYKGTGKGLAVLFVYGHYIPENYDSISEKMKKLIGKLVG